MASFTVAVCQMDSRDDKRENVEKALDGIDEAAARGADLVSFPEAFTFMGPAEERRAAAEPIPGPTTDRLAARAAERGLHVHAGSMHEATETGEKVRNTTVFVDDNGDVRATYSKLHLFDVTLGEEVVAEESALVEPGEEPVVVETELATFGLSICYDLRFPELYATLARRGAEVLFVPSAFRAFTGKDHWESLLRARAIENQAYVVAAGQIGTKPESGPRHGKSMVVDPWGTVVAQASDREDVITARIDLDYLEDIRTKLPSLTHKRPGVY